MKTILPGRTIGILGSGQLGRMFTLEAKRMGYSVHTFSPDKNSPTGQIADIEVIGNYDDVNAALKFAQGVDVVTFEFENIAKDVVKKIEKNTAVHPNSYVLSTAQHRHREKIFLEHNNIPVAPFEKIGSREELHAAVKKIGAPAILKTAGFGYDGKGQAKIRTVEQADAAYDAIGAKEAILEAFIDFSCEVSVVAARGQDGTFVAFDVVENQHTNHILDVTYAPATISAELQAKAIEITRGVMERLDCVGVLCVEMFVTKDGGLLVNEIAPRPHNSGHWTIDACITNQFEQQIRAICGLPLGSTERIFPFAAMVNILGDIWQNGEPKWDEVLAEPHAKLHLYGKHEARVGRKMGHVNITGSTAEEVSATVKRVKKILGIKAR